MTTPWTRSQVDQIAQNTQVATRVYALSESQQTFNGLHIWDPWPVLDRQGRRFSLGDEEVWMALSAPGSLPPIERHAVARILLLTRKDDRWINHGPVFPEGSSAGLREWSGCATWIEDSRQIEIWYTAAGAKGETVPSYIQRLYCCRCDLSRTADGLHLSNWTAHFERIDPSSHYRSTLQQATGEIGFIKAFRDPCRFIDPRDGQLYVLFTASLSDSETEFDGAVGIARAADDIRFEAPLEVLPPLIHSDGVNNELERPHILYRDDLYYLFISTQARTFHPEVTGVTGLYGFASSDLKGPWTPLNGSGLVLRNPEAEPFQAYSWTVLDDLSVVAFLDYPNLDGETPDAVEARGQGLEYFSGAISPFEKLVLDGTRSRVVQT